MEKVYIIEIEWRNDGVTEFEVMEVCDTMETARKYFLEERENIINDYTSGGGFNVEDDKETHYCCQRGDYWDEYYELWIIEKEITKQ